MGSHGQYGVRRWRRLTPARRLLGSAAAVRGVQARRIFDHRCKKTFATQSSQKPTSIHRIAIRCDNVWPSRAV